MRLITALTISLVLLSPLSMASEDADQGFRIMDQAEIDQHIAAMRNLQGDPRDEYRNRVYAELRERARQHGYAMPETPPWASHATAGSTFRPGGTAQSAAPVPQKDESAAAVAAVAPAPAAPKPATQETQASQQTASEATPAAADTPDMDKLVAQQKQVIEEAVQARAEETTQATTPATPAVNSYREQMRKRFDDFMARREARQQQARQQQAGQPTAPSYPQAMQPQAPMPPRMPAYAAPAYPKPAYPQPAYPQPAPVYPAPPRPAYPGYAPYGQPPAPPVPGWY